MKSTQLYVVIQFENGWDNAPGEKTTFFTEKKQAMALFKEYLKEIKEEGVSNQVKVLLAKVEIGKTFNFCGYGDFEGAEVIKLAEFEE